MEIVECMLDQVRTMEENLLKLKKGDVRVPVHRYIYQHNIRDRYFFFKIGTAEDQVHGKFLPED